MSNGLESNQLQGRRDDGSEDKDLWATKQTIGPEFNPQDPGGRKKELTGLQLSSDIPLYMVACPWLCEYTHQVTKQLNKMHKKI